MIRFFRAVLLAFVASIISACSSTHSYTNANPENLLITTDIRSGAARLHVYDLDEKCNAGYQGTVELSDQKMKVGLPTNKASYLVFNFYGGSMFTGRSSTSYYTYLIPRAGYHYEAAVNYVDNMYGATIYEQDARGGGRHKVPRMEPPCAVK